MAWMLKGWEARFLKVTTTVSWTSAWMVGPRRPEGEKEGGGIALQTGKQRHCGNCSLAGRLGNKAMQWGTPFPPHQYWAGTTQSAPATLSHMTRARHRIWYSQAKPMVIKKIQEFWSFVLNTVTPQPVCHTFTSYPSSWAWVLLAWMSNPYILKTWLSCTEC